jgi:hypothetical protein
MEDDAVEEGVGESSWPAAASAGGGGGGGGYTDIRKEIFDRLMAKGIEEVVADPPAFRQLLDRHFERLPARSARAISVCLSVFLFYAHALASYLCLLASPWLTSDPIQFPVAATPSIWTSRRRRTCCCTTGSSTSAPILTNAPSSMPAS